MTKGINIELLMSFMGVAIALVIGTVIYSSVSEVMDETIIDNGCSGINATSSELCIQMNQVVDNGNNMFVFIPIMVIIAGVLLVVVRLPEMTDHDNDPNTPKIKVSTPLYKIIILRSLLIMGLAKEVKKDD